LHETELRRSFDWTFINLWVFFVIILVLSLIISWWVCLISTVNELNASIITVVFLVVVLEVAGQFLLLESDRLEVRTIIKIDYAPLQLLEHQHVFVLRVDAQEQAQIGVDILVFLHAILCEELEELLGLEYFHLRVG
jgi:hypothetical protein